MTEIILEDITITQEEVVKGNLQKKKNIFLFLIQELE